MEKHQELNLCQSLTSLLGKTTRFSRSGIIPDLTDGFVVAEVEREQVDIFGQLHQALVVSTTGTTWRFSLEVTLPIGEVSERPSRRLLSDPSWRYETPSNLCAKVYPPLLR